MTPITWKNLIHIYQILYLANPKNLQLSINWKYPRCASRLATCIGYNSYKDSAVAKKVEIV